MSKDKEKVKEELIKVNAKIDKLNLEIEQKFERQEWISMFCASLSICTIVGPSVLWIKAYITLRFMSYIMNELIQKIMKIRQIPLKCFVRGKTDDIFAVKIDNTLTINDLKRKVSDKITQQEKNFDQDFDQYCE